MGSARSGLLLDVSRLVARGSDGRLHTGIDRVCFEYLNRYRRNTNAILLRQQWRRLLSPSTSQALFDLIQQGSVAHFARKVRWEVAKACVPPWPAQDAGRAVSLYLGHWGLETPGFERWIHQTRQRPVYMVHDLIPVTHPEYCRVGEDQRHRRRLDVVLRTAAAVIANSDDTRNALSDYAQSHRHPLPPVVVAPLASALTPTLPAVTAPLLTKPYFVVVGTIESRKNHLLLLNAWRELTTRLGPDTPKLVIVGQRGWECEQVADLLDRCPALQPHVKEVANCPDAELVVWLRHARALLFPSFVEGYGMPLVEALAVGTPVIASDLPVFKESAGDVPEWLNPIDGTGWVQAIVDYSAGDHPRRQAQLDRLQRWLPPTWDKHFDIVDELLERLA